MPAPDSFGGPIACEPPLVEALREKGLDIVTEVYVYGDKLKPTPFFERVRRVLKTAFRFRKLVREFRPALIFLNSAFDRRTILRDSVSIFLMGAGDARIFVKLHGSTAEDFQKPGFLFGMLIRYLRRNVNSWGYFTNAELEAFAAIGFDRAKFFPVRNVIELGEDQGSEPQRQKEPDDIFELLFVARFIPTKGLLPTIFACEELRKRGVRFRLTCVGDGETYPAAKDAVGRLGLGRVITFTGHLPESEVSKRFVSSDIFVFPTTHPEGFPITLFKAVKAGMPIVTTNTRAAADFLADPENCLYCTTDPSNIADMIEKLIADKPARERMADANREYGLTLTPEKIADEFIDIFDRVLGDSVPNRSN